MTAKWLVSMAVALAVVGCGSSSSDGSSTGGGGGGGGGGGNTLPSGTLAGTAFTPADGTAAVLPPTSCSVAGTGVNGNGVAIVFTNVAGTSGTYQSVGACNDKANATVVSAIVARVNVTGGTAAAIGPGTYTLTPGTPFPDASGNVNYTFLGYSKTNATCVNAAASVTATSGTVTISTLTGTRATGSLTVAFSDGSTFSGPFDVALCNVSFDVCALQSCTGPASCIP
jgi:hypothetical protein